MPRLQLVTLLARGGMGEVWKAWDSLLNRWVALKFCDDAGHLHEARAAARLNHPNIAAVYDVTEHEGRECIAIEYVDGKNLDVDLGLPPRRVAEVIRDAARAVAFAHANGVIHRDLKPENIMVTAAGHVFVMDFGLSSMGAEGVLAGEVVGTPAYISPSQARGVTAEARDDVYSLGATLVELLKPFQHDQRLAAIAAKAASKIAGERHQTAAELADELDAYLRAARRRRNLVAACAAVILAAVCAFGATQYSAHIREAIAMEAAMNQDEAEVKLANDDDAGAIEAFTRALAIRPDLKTYLDRGFCYYRMGDYEKAIADCDAALNIDPGNEAAKKNRERAMKYASR